MRNYIEISDLPISENSDVSKVLGLDINGEIIKAPLQQDIQKNTSDISDIKDDISNIENQISEINDELQNNDTQFSNINTQINQLNEIYNDLDSEKQDTLISGENIKTINGQSILGNGDIEITGNVTVDSELSTSSNNPVQNKIITNAINEINATIGNINNTLTEING